MKFFARSPDNKDLDKSHWDPLATHLKNVGQLASKFGTTDMQQICKFTGQWHDLGKYRSSFQQYLRGEISGSRDTHHAAYGAALAKEFGCTSIAFAIAGHHAGLHNPADLKRMLGDDYPTDQYLPKLKEHFLQEIGPLPEILEDPEFVKNGDCFVQEFFVRMLFSCLTDADVLDAQRFHLKLNTPAAAKTLNHELMITRLNHHMRSLSTNPSSTLNQLRHTIHEHCHHAALHPQGIFTLTVPTGGGKTLSAIRFAVEHARIHKLERIIVVIPYLSIIEQTADIYRKIFDPHNEGIVIEHHCAVKEKVKLNQPSHDKLTLGTQSAENWDAPIVVTTTVQFIESLFACSPKRCRKLHNIIQSVVLMDEVHTLPYHLLEPLINVLRQLKQHYNTTLLLSTATKPSLQQGTHFNHGFDPSEIQEIIPQPEHFFQHLSRVRCHYKQTSITWQDLVDLWQSNETQALGIINTRSQAKDLYQTMVEHHGENGVFHLSSAMCPEHRSAVLSSVQAQLKQKNTPCYLISTQVIEAGVDIDFPSVYRAIAPLDSLIQAAGRCNREGKLADKGNLIIFTPQDHSLPPGTYTFATSLTQNFLKSLLSKGQSLDDILNQPQTFTDYFTKLFPFIARQSAESSNSVQENRRLFRFRDVAKQTKVIADEGMSVVVPYGNSIPLIAQLKHQPINSKPLIRQLQRYMITLRQNEFDRAHTEGLLAEIVPGIIYRLNDTVYHPQLGCVL